PPARPGSPAPRTAPRFPTTRPPAELSEFLVKPAERAMEQKRYARAVSLYSGLRAARGDADPSALQLAKAWNLANQYEEAARVYEAFARATTDLEKRDYALEQVARLREFQNPFQREYRPDYARKEATIAYKRGRKAFARKQYGDALLYYRMALAIDPTLNGPVREIGRTYAKLGAKDEAARFYLDYLWRSPAGPFAKEVVAELKKLGKADELGTLTVDSKLPCDEVWVEGQLVRRKLPIKNLPVAPGRYTWLCFSARYAMAYFEQVDVKKGEHAHLEFHWAVVVNELENPWGRIVVENARQRGTMMDLGLEVKELGIVVPADGSALRMLLKDPTGAVVEERFVRIASGSRYVVRWKNRGG
ncbi:MAG: hypothetical protein D6689_21750, partial [Deltaproteobacteria bacterium]